MGKRMRELAQIRQELDEIDREMVKLFERRMTLCREVARTKLAQGKPVLDASREAQVLESRAAMLTDASLAEAVQAHRFKKGDLIALAGFGAGLTWASCIMKWAKED